MLKFQYTDRCDEKRLLSLSFALPRIHSSTRALWALCLKTNNLPTQYLLMTLGGLHGSMRADGWLGDHWLQFRHRAPLAAGSLLCGRRAGRCHAPCRLWEIKRGAGMEALGGGPHPVPVLVT